MAKSPDAFRTISEVADWLGVQAHVLRFWESKFAQVKPIKRAGGRRYYRPADMLLLGGLKKVLHEDGLTIKGAQKLLREKGVSYVADLSQPLDDLTIAVIEGTSTPVESTPSAPLAEPATPDEMVEADTEAHPVDVPEPVSAASDHGTLTDAKETEDARDADEPAEPEAPPTEPGLQEFQADELDADTPEASEEQLDDTDEDQPDLPLEDLPNADDEAAPTITFRARHRETAPPPASEPTSSDVIVEDTPNLPETEDAAPDTPPAAGEDTTEQPKPNRIDVTLVHDHSQIAVAPSALSAIASLTKLTPEQAQEVRPLLARLTRLRASMANPRKDLGKD